MQRRNVAACWLFALFSLAACAHASGRAGLAWGPTSPVVNPWDSPPSGGCRGDAERDASGSGYIYPYSNVLIDTNRASSLKSDSFLSDANLVLPDSAEVVTQFSDPCAEVAVQEAKPPDNSPPGPETKNASAAAAGAKADETVDPQVVEEAKAGDMVAQYKLGYDYYLGKGVALDFTQAAIWWRKAADQGYADAQNNLGVLYNSGRGVPQSYAEAYFWQNLAAARANGAMQTQFAKNRDDSATKISFLERLRVQKRASKWATEHPVAPRSAEPKSKEAPQP